jgi:hypothetical protein
VPVGDEDGPVLGVGVADGSSDGVWDAGVEGDALGAAVTSAPLGSTEADGLDDAGGTLPSVPLPAEQAASMATRVTPVMRTGIRWVSEEVMVWAPVWV